MWFLCLPSHGHLMPHTAAVLAHHLHLLSSPNPPASVPTYLHQGYLYLVWRTISFPDIVYGQFFHEETNPRLGLPRSPLYSVIKSIEIAIMCWRCSLFFLLQRPQRPTFVHCDLFIMILTEDFFILLLNNITDSSIQNSLSSSRFRLFDCEPKLIRLLLKPMVGPLLLQRRPSADGPGRRKGGLGVIGLGVPGVTLLHGSFGVTWWFGVLEPKT